MVDGGDDSHRLRLVARRNIKYPVSRKYLTHQARFEAILYLLIKNIDGRLWYTEERL